MNHTENGIKSADCQCASLATPEYIEVPTANGRTTVRKDEMIRRLHKNIDVFVGNLHFGA